MDIGQLDEQLDFNADLSDLYDLAHQVMVYAAEPQPDLEDPDFWVWWERYAILRMMADTEITIREDPC